MIQQESIVKVADNSGPKRAPGNPLPGRPPPPPRGPCAPGHARGEASLSRRGEPRHGHRATDGAREHPAPFGVDLMPPPHRVPPLRGGLCPVPARFPTPPGV